MEVHLVNKEGTTAITELITSVILNGEYRSACRTLDISILQTNWSTYIPLINIEVGDIIGVLEDKELIFYGMVWSKDKNTTGHEINIHCKDYGIYLIKNSYSYKFNGLTPEAITKKLCGDYGISIGNIANTGVAINRNFMSNSLYDIIMTSYTLSNTGKYMIRFTGGQLNVIKKGKDYADKEILTGDNLLTASISETLEQMLNTVYIKNKNNELIDTIANKDDSNKYGLLSTELKIDKEDYKNKANKMLKGLERKIKVTNFGDKSFVTGNCVIVQEHWTKLFGKFYIDADTHTWKNGIYSNSLTLNFENLMDEKEVGSIEEEKKKKGRKGKAKKGNGEEFKYINPPK